MVPPKQNACRLCKPDHAISFNPTVRFGNRVHRRDHENLNIVFMICNEWIYSCNAIMNFGYMNGHSYHLPWLNYGCKIECLQNAPYWQNLQSECQLKQRHRFYQPLFNWGWFFKDYLALEPKTLEHRISASLFWKMKIMNTRPTW